MIEKPAGTTQVHVSLCRQAPVRRDLAELTKGVNSFVYEASSLPRAVVYFVAFAYACFLASGLSVAKRGPVLPA